MRRLYALVLAVALGVCARTPAAGQPEKGPAATSSFKVTTTPVYKGIRATADLPTSQHRENVGGSDGKGLCVYTSVLHSAFWQSVDVLYGFRGWMEKRPGGSFPEKFEQTLSAYCKEKGIPCPGCLQHTGGDEDILDLAMKTGRMVGVTYCGMDGRYRDRAGNEIVIAHMVSLIHLDAVTPDRPESECLACIIDNNHPGTFLWMPRRELLARWRGVRADGRSYLARDEFGRERPVGGGWLIILLYPPPPPYAEPPAVSAVAGCQCGEGCKCPQGSCPLQCPAQPIQFRLRDRFNPFPAAPSCPGGNCPAPNYGPSPVPEVMPTGRWIETTTPGEYGYWIGDRCTAFTKGGKAYAVDSNNVATGREIIPPAALPVRAPGPVGVEPPQFPPGGVDSSKLTAESRYWCFGDRCSKADAKAVLNGKLDDDSGRWNVAIVGEPAFLRKVLQDLAKLDPKTAEKIQIKTYAPDAWQVGQFGLSPGVTLRKPAVGRIGGNVGTIEADQYTAAALVRLAGVPSGPSPRPVEPPPMPTPKPPVLDPLPPPTPKADPKPGPAEPVAEPVDQAERVEEFDDWFAPLALMGVVCAGGWVVLRRK